MNDLPTSGPNPVFGILAGIVLIIALIGGSIYLISDLSVQRERAVAEQWNARAQVESARAYAQVELARAHESGSTERMQVFALTLKSLTAENQGTITLLSVGVLLLGILQLVQALTRPR
jgi:uncharacterized membrane protein YraQ (UPF0718 family)